MIRAAGPDDLEALIRLRVLMFEAMGTAPRDLAAPMWRTEAGHWFAAKIADDHTRILLVESDDEVVAGGLAEVLPAIPAPSMPRGRLGFISNVATHPHARGRGHARAVVTELVRWLDDEGDVDRIDLAATSGGVPLYSSLGFVESVFPTMRRLPPERHR